LASTPQPGPAHVRQIPAAEASPTITDLDHENDASAHTNTLRRWVSTATYADVYKKKKKKKKEKKVDCFAISESTMARRVRGYLERTAGDDN
jgi:hypothetical protein